MRVPRCTNAKGLPVERLGGNWVSLSARLTAGHDLTKGARFAVSTTEVINLCPDPVAPGAYRFAGIDMRVPQHEVPDLRPK
eukprot:CAMPEP_0198206374 /NCGR_PEP_ID=MMETSP1445-20131203/9902_1 /TAXON_ID=36898 /ORGANISM="Pyramimonas sp., Strain CCMP2087" /LENGTH=80 /DNA_ID=CAMNT_0043879035 /DNA_START=1 /DNA_END=244 /DNA_ORIENTATION=-